MGEHWIPSVVVEESYLDNSPGQNDLLNATKSVLLTDRYPTSLMKYIHP